MKLKVVQLWKWQSADLLHVSYPIDNVYNGVSYLGISRIRIENVRKEFAGTSDAGYDEPMDVEAVDNEKM